MTDPILYLSMILGLGGVYVLVASLMMMTMTVMMMVKSIYLISNMQRREDSLNNTKILLAERYFIWQY